VISLPPINLLGEYDFSDEKLQDNVGIRPPKLTLERGQKFEGCRTALCASVNGTCRNCVGLYVPLLEFSHFETLVKLD
jgi:hypothetical protein